MALPVCYFHYSISLISMIMTMMHPSMIGWASATKNHHLPSVNGGSFSPPSSLNHSNTSILSSHDMTLETSMFERHDKWMEKYGRVYKDVAEKEVRFNIFKQNVEYIESVNNGGGHSYKLGVNKFADLTHDELKAYFACYHSNPPETSINTKRHDNMTTLTHRFRYPKLMDELPESVDWKANGAVTPVRDQLNCGSCWAFAAVETTEAIHQIYRGDLVTLSVQQLIDCDRDNGNNGCTDGNPAWAFAGFIQNPGLTTDDDYPYKGVEGTCEPDAATGITISGYFTIPADNEQAVLEVVVEQPVTATISVGSREFYFLNSFDVFSGPCADPNDNQQSVHAVTIIGYGTDTGGSEKKYWLIKNHWGTEWGQGGYARIERDANICAIGHEAYYPYITDE